MYLALQDVRRPELEHTDLDGKDPIREERAHAEGQWARKEAKEKRKAAKVTAEHVGLVAKQSTLQRCAQGAATITCTPMMKTCKRGCFLEGSEHEQ